MKFLIKALIGLSTASIIGFPIYSSQSKSRVIHLSNGDNIEKMIHHYDPSFTRNAQDMVKEFKLHEANMGQLIKVFHEELGYPSEVTMEDFTQDKNEVDDYTKSMIIGFCKNWEEKDAEKVSKYCKLNQ